MMGAEVRPRPSIGSDGQLWTPTAGVEGRGGDAQNLAGVRGNGVAVAGMAGHDAGEDSRGAGDSPGWMAQPEGG